MAQENGFCDIREFLCTLQHMQHASFHSQINL